MKVADVDELGNATAFVNPRRTLTLVGREQDRSVGAPAPAIRDWAHRRAQSARRPTPQLFSACGRRRNRSSVHRAKRTDRRRLRLPESPRAPAGRARADRGGSRPDVPARTPDAHRPEQSPSTAGASPSGIDARARERTRLGQTDPTAVSPSRQQRDSPATPRPGIANAIASQRRPRRPRQSPARAVSLEGLRAWCRARVLDLDPGVGEGVEPAVGILLETLCAAPASTSPGVSAGSRLQSGSRSRTATRMSSMRLAMKRRPAGERLEQNATEGRDVGALVERLATRLFGTRCHAAVPNTSRAARAPCRDSRLAHDRVPLIRHRRRRASSRGRSRESSPAPSGRELDIRRLQIAVNDAAVVSGFQSFRDLTRRLTTPRLSEADRCRYAPAASNPFESSSSTSA